MGLHTFATLIVWWKTTFETIPAKKPELKSAFNNEI